MSEPSDKDPKDKSGMGDVLLSMREIWRMDVRNRAAAAARKRGTALDPAAMSDEDFERWDRVAVEDSIEEERSTANAEALKRQSELATSLRSLPPEEFEWIDPRSPKLLHERVADAKVALAAARAAAEDIVSGKALRVLLVGPAGSGKTSLAAVVTQVLPVLWAKERFRRETARLDARPAAVVAEERIRARNEAVRDVDARQLRTTVPRPGGPEGLPADATPAAKTLAKVLRGKRIEADWTTAHKLFKLAKKPIGFRETDPLDVYREVPILVLDDIGGEPMQANVAPVEDVLRERHDAQRITIATTGMFDESADPNNLDALLQPLAARYGAAVVRRLAEKGRAVVVRVGVQGARKVA